MQTMTTVVVALLMVSNKFTKGNNMRYAIMMVMGIAFLAGMHVPMRQANSYSLIQKENGGIIVIEKNLSALACGLKKKWVRNGYCVTTKTAKSWRIQ